MLAVPIEPTAVVTIEAHPRTGAPQVRPSFTASAVYLHPVPKPLVGAVHAGERWAGRYGRLHRPTGLDGAPKHDARGMPLYVRYFIPLRRVADHAP